MPAKKNLKTGDCILMVMSEDHAQLAGYRKKFRITQTQAVDHLIETTYFGSEYLPRLVGGRGTPEERIAALRQAIEEDSTKY